MSDEAIRKTTGKTWPEWQAVFQHMGAKDMAHTEIVTAISESHDVSVWWAQTLTVRFEQELGRRQPGQTCDGDFQVSVSATVSGTMDDALARWTQHMDGCKDVNGVPLGSKPTVTVSEKWRYWRVPLADGSRVTVSISNKTGGKALLQVNHDKLADNEAVETWRACWKSLINDHKQRTQ